MTDKELDELEQMATTAHDEEFLLRARDEILRLVAEVRRLRRPVEAARIVKGARAHFEEADEIRTALYCELRKQEKDLDEALKEALVGEEESIENLTS